MVLGVVGAQASVPKALVIENAYIEVNTSGFFDAEYPQGLKPIAPLRRLAGDEPQWPGATGAPEGATFQVRCIVLADGSPRLCRAWGPREFREPLLKAVRTWRFDPYKVKGGAEPVTYVFKVRVDGKRPPTAPPAASLEDCERYFEMIHEDDNGPPPLVDEAYLGCVEGGTTPAEREPGERPPRDK
jgi:hypothetical protein